MAIDDDDDLDEYDADVFQRERLVPSICRRDWDHRRNRTASQHHNRAQLLTLANSLSVSSLSRFREDFHCECRWSIEEIDRRLLNAFVNGHSRGLMPESAE